MARPPRDAGTTASRLAPCLTSSLAGYSGASLDRKTLLASAMLLGALWATSAIVMSVISGSDESVWYRLAVTIVIVFGTTVGGMLHIHNTRFTSRDEDQDSLGKPVAS